MKVHRQIVSHNFFTWSKNNQTSAIMSTEEKFCGEEGDALIYISDKTEEKSYWRIESISKRGKVSFFAGKEKREGNGIYVQLCRFNGNVQDL